MPNIPVNNCCGCTACSQICPLDAIRMQPNQEGFLYPVVDNAKCISCGKCEKVCPVKFPPPVSETLSGCVIAQNTNDQILLESTSGGFMDALNQYVVECYSGFAVGVAFGADFLPEHRIAATVEDTVDFRNSKYAQSNLGDVFRKIRSLLESGSSVLFTGTPCQVAGLKAFLGKEYETLITADLVCRSIPSPALWRLYLDWQEERAGSPVREVACRRKTYGYHHGALEILFENGKRYAGSNRVDYYMKAFHGNICSRPSCYCCPFKTVHRCSDFTVFDCGYPQKVALEPVADDDRGFSSVLVHTQKGRDLLNRLKGIRKIQADPEKMFLYTGGMECCSISKPTARDVFYEDLGALGFCGTMKKHVKTSWKDWILEWVKPFWYRLRKWKNGFFG